LITSFVAAPCTDDGPTYACSDVDCFVVAHWHVPLPPLRHGCYSSTVSDASGPNLEPSFTFGKPRASLSYLKKQSLLKTSLSRAQVLDEHANRLKFMSSTLLLAPLPLNVCSPRFETFIQATRKTIGNSLFGHFGVPSHH